MIDRIKKMDDNQILRTIKTYEDLGRKGDGYIRNLFFCALIYYVDKFGEETLPEAIKKIFIWAYSLRLKLDKVRFESVDNYALGKAHSEIQFFKMIREATNPNVILNITLEVLQESQLKREIAEIVEFFRDWGYCE
jgi:hypothetical protein